MIHLVQEHRLALYQSNWDRFVDTTKGYDYSDPMQAIAGGVNVFTQGAGLDPLIKDVGRSIDGNTSELPPYGSFLGRTVANTREAIGDALRLKPISAVTKLINVPGDLTADLADSMAGVSRN